MAGSFELDLRRFTAKVGNGADIAVRKRAFEHRNDDRIMHGPAFANGISRTEYEVATDLSWRLSAARR